MSSLERLPADQRAVLALVLQRGRSYDEIASLLAIDRAAVRDRALAALDALGPSEPRVPAEQRALITDYLLGQLPPRVRDQMRQRLANSPSARAWARILASELAPLSANPLPEIPAAAPEAAEPDATATPAAAPPAPPAATPEPTATPSPAPEPTREAAAASSSGNLPRPAGGAQRPSSRVGGGALLALALIIAVVVVVVILINNGSNSNKPRTTRAGTPTTTTGTTTTGTTTTAIHPVADIVMKPASSAVKARGVAEIVTQGKVTGVIVAADHLTPNTKHNAYAVWLASPGGPYHLLGYVSPGVGKAGTLKTSGPLPSNASSFKRILITLETTTSTKIPGQTILSGTL
jgi:hypothetical protein